MTSEYERNVEEAQAEATNLQEKIDSLNSSLGAHVVELEERLKEAKKENETKTLHLQEELRSLLCMLANWSTNCLH